MFSFYERSSRAARVRMASVGEPLAFASGADVFREGDEQRDLLLVSKGSVRVFKTSDTGREITLYHVEDGQPCLVNILAVLTATPAVAAGRAEVPTDALVLPGRTVRELMAESEAFRDYVVESLAARLVDVMTLIEEIAFGKMDSRLASFLLNRFGSEASVQATHESIAAELGTAREVVSRLLREFARRGAVDVGRGRIELRHRATLEAIRRGKP